MKKVVSLLALALASAALVACGGSNSTTTTTSQAGGEASGGAASGSASTLKFEADPSGKLAYTTKQVTAKAGKATIELHNGQALPHDVAIEDSSGKVVGKTATVTEGDDTTTVDLKPGSYKFFCSVPGHRQAGMEGTLTVK